MAIRSWLITAALSAALSLPAAARPAPEWELLGSRRVNFAGERDVIDVGGREGRFTALKLDVNGGNIEMYDVRIIFQNGDSWSPATRLVFREGSWSRTIDLPGRARTISRIEFRYRSQLRRGRATLQVYGRAGTAEPAGPTSRVGSAPVKPGWDHLGTRRVSVRADHDAIAAGAQGAFRRVMIEVDGGTVEMWDVVITFANGERYSPATRLIFNANTRSRVIDLPGLSRIIRRIDFRYRSLDRWGANTAAVHVYGRR